jgi:hypothetical protein
MIRTICAAFLLAVTIHSPHLRAEGRKFQGFGVTSHEVAGLRFSFSEADASSSSPVVISVTGRELTDKDRVHRTSLQEYWLSINVPKHLRLRSHTLDECDYRRAGERPSCDHYTYQDPATGKEFDYYIYVGNWP